MMKQWTKCVLVLAVCLVLAVLVWNTEAMAAGGSWSGSGTSSSPYLLVDEADLRKLAENVNAGESYHTKYFALGQDITLTEVWTPIGTAEAPFRGTFRGADYNITGLSSEVDYGGLFGCLGSGAYVSNVTLKELSLKGGTYLGGIAGMISTDDSSVSIYNCTVSGTISAYIDSDTDAEYVGGIAGCVTAASGSVVISGCEVSGTLSGDKYMGGIVGAISCASSCQIRSCVNNAYINGGSNSYNCGGIAGNAVERDSGYISFWQCVNNGYIKGNAYSDDNGSHALGGIAGYASGITIYGCVNTGAVSSFFGAGIACDAYGVDIEQCINFGKMTASSDGHGGAIVCRYFNSGVTKTDCYTLSGCGSTSAGGTSVTSEQVSSGELTWMMGNTVFGQTIGVDPRPVFATANNEVCQVKITGVITSTYYFNDGNKISLPVPASCMNYYLSSGQLFLENSLVYGDITLTAEGPFHDYQSVVTEATCTTDGYTTHTCSKCSDTYVDSEVAQYGHDLSDWSDDDGKTHSRSCSRCEYGETEDHGWDEGTVLSEPGCITGGETVYHCAGCGTSRTEYADKLGHDYAETVTAPTCTDEGYTTHTCSRCADTYDDSFVDPLGHEYAAAETAPTCTEEGYTTHTCIRCPDSYTDSYVDSLGHSFGLWMPLDGVNHIRYCGRGDCDGKETAAHNLEKGETTAPTCTEDGYTLYHCSDCGGTQQKDPVEALGHSCDAWAHTDGTGGSASAHEGVCGVCHTALSEPCRFETTVVAPTCAKTGYTKHVCSLCSYQYRTDTTPVQDHDYAVYTPDGNATCTQDGTETAHCAYGCGNTDTRTDEGSALGHDFSDWTPIVEATYFHDGEETRSCSRQDCGEAETRTAPIRQVSWYYDGQTDTLMLANVPADATVVLALYQDGKLRYTELCAASELSETWKLPTQVQASELRVFFLFSDLKPAAPVLRTERTAAVQ